MAKKQNKLPKDIKLDLTLRDKIKVFYNQSLRRYNLAAFLGFFIGAKLCDLIFYDPVKLEIVRQQMQDEYWALNGEPKHLKPQIVQSHEDPIKMRKSWIQIIYGKDTYIPKEA